MTAFSATRFEALVRDRQLALGVPVTAVSVTGSTNDDAMAAARAGVAHGATFVADLQTRGRGRRGRTWSSPPGENLTFSVVLRPRLELARVTALPLVVGLAVRDAVAARVALPVELKWPNDVLADRRKLAGILVESQLRGRDLAALVVGVGVNVAMRELPAEIAGVATSLALCGASDLALEPLLADILASLAARCATFETLGLAAFLDELARCDALEGSRVRTEGVEGIARGIDGDGALLVEQDDGEVARVVAGAVEAT